MVTRLYRCFSTKILSTDGNTIVCLHPKKIPTIVESKSFRIRNQVLQNRNVLSPQEIELVKKCRAQDPSVWTINTLASLFNVRRVDISRLAPATKERQMQLDEDRKMLKMLPLRQRRTIIAKKEATRQKKLKTYLSQLNCEDFPGLKNEKLKEFNQK